MTSRREQVCEATARHRRRRKAGLFWRPVKVTKEATARHRRRRKAGLFWRPVKVTKDQLDQLEARGYLGPDRGGDRAEECDAIEMFLTDSLLKG